MQSIVGKYLCAVAAGSAATKLLSKQSLRGIHLSSIVNMAVTVGDKIPSSPLYEGTPANKVNLAEESADKKIIVFAVPGAFTPGCSKTHLPGFLAEADNLKQQGISGIYCVSINDPFVMAAWGEAQKAEGKVRMLADSNGSFTKELGLDQDLPPLGGVRSKRYSMVVENATIKSLNVEPDGTGLSCSLASHIKV